MIFLTILICFVFFAGVAMTVNEGLWSNTVSLICVVLGGLMAVTAGVPLGNWGLEQSGRDAAFTWYFSFAGIWGVFALTVTLLRVAADKCSRVRMRFIPLVDKIAGPLMGLFVAVMFASFAAFTMIECPFRAGEWDLAKAASWQKSTFQYARGPFYNVAKRFVDADGVETPFFTK